MAGDFNGPETNPAAIQMRYIEPVFRPPSEARSLILQVTNGCSWNRCRFCEMYTQPQKRFRPKPFADIEAEIKQIAATGYPVRRIFLADGDAMTLSLRRLTEILDCINAYLQGSDRLRRMATSICPPRPGCSSLRRTRS